MATGTVPPRRRLDPAARRQQLVALGLELIKERPFDQVLIDEVIAAAGISKGLLFHYFASKRDFQLAVVRAASAELLAAIRTDPALDVLGQLRAGLDAYVRWIEENAAGYTAIARGAGSDDALLAVFEETRDAIVSVIVGRIVASGLAPGETPILRLAARGWIASVEESTFLWLRDRPCTRDQLLELLTRAALQLAPMATELSDA